MMSVGCAGPWASGEAQCRGSAGPRRKSWRRGLAEVSSGREGTRAASRCPSCGSYGEMLEQGEVLDRRMHRVIPF
jgi:hypothetical protein